MTQKNVSYFETINDQVLEQKLRIQKAEKALIQLQSQQKKQKANSKVLKDINREHQIDENDN